LAKFHVLKISCAKNGGGGGGGGGGVSSFKKMNYW